MSMWRRLLAPSVVVAIGLTLAACSSSPTTSAPPSTTATTAAGETTTAPVKVPNDVNVRKDVTLVNCDATAGGWSAGGTVKNSLNHSATYDITVFFTSTHAEDLAYAATSVPVDAGQSKLWSVKASFAAPSSVLCVLRGVATS